MDDLIKTDKGIVPHDFLEIKKCIRGFIKNL